MLILHSRMRFLPTSGLVYEIDRTIASAQDFLLLVTPYVKLSQNFYERLQDATERGADVALICRFESLKGQTLDDLLELRGVQVFDHPGLHAKCFANEAQAVIGSMNLYQHSEGNREMGIVVPSNTPVYKEAIAEVHSIMKAAEEVSRPSRARVKLRSIADSARGVFGAAIDRFKGEQPGACIRCGTDVPFDPARPYCGSCYASWARFSNEQYTEKHCHDCGEAHRTSMVKPVCRSCFKKAVA